MESSQFTDNQSHYEAIEQMETQGATCDTFRVKLYGKLHFLKRLKAEHAGDIRYQEALRKEFETGYCLEHPNLVRYLSLDDNSILMDYVDGETLSTGYESDEYYSWLLPKSKLEKRVYKMNKLEVKDVGKGIKFVSDEGFVARIFWSNINGHGYYSWGGQERIWREENKYEECYVLSVEYHSPWDEKKHIIEEPLDEKKGCINLYRDINQKVQVGIILAQWYNKEGWDDSKSAYSEDGKLLVDQWENDGILDDISIAYIAEKNALYVEGELYYKK